MVVAVEVNRCFVVGDNCITTGIELRIAVTQVALPVFVQVVEYHQLHGAAQSVSQYFLHTGQYIARHLEGIPRQRFTARIKVDIDVPVGIEFPVETRELNTVLAEFSIDALCGEPCRATQENQE